MSMRWNVVADETREALVSETASSRLLKLLGVLPELPGYGHDLALGGPASEQGVYREHTTHTRTLSAMRLPRRPLCVQRGLHA